MLPFILIPIAVAGGAGGLGFAFNGVDDLGKAKEVNKYAIQINDEMIKNFEGNVEKSNSCLQKLGETELRVTSYFQHFVNAFEKIKNKPEFHNDIKNEHTLPEFDFQEIKEISNVVNVLLGGIGAAGAAGIFGAVATAGTTSAVLALGTASTGTPIAVLAGAAAHNAALAALGGGAIAAGGGGMALGAFVLNAMGVGVGLFIGGCAFAVMGNKAYKKADEVLSEVFKSEEIINENVIVLETVTHSSRQLRKIILEINNSVYIPNVVKLNALVKENNDWNSYSIEEKKLVENNIRIVSVLHKLANTSLYKTVKTDEDGKVVEIEANITEVNQNMSDSINAIKEII